MSIRSELLSIQHEMTDNVLHAADVVEWARGNRDSDLYRSLEWDNQKAADAHRLWQVRQLIQLHVVSDDGAPMMVSLSIDRRAGGGYRSVSEVVEKPDLRQIMLQDALAELERVQAKFERVQELASVWEAADRTREAAGMKRRRRTSSREAVTA